MKPVDEGDKRAVFERKRDEILRNFGTEVPNESNEATGKAIEALVLEVGRLRLVAGSTSLEANLATDNGTRKLASSIDAVDPVQAHAEKMIKLALAGKYAEAGEYASKLGTLRGAEVNEAIRNMAASGGKKKHEKSNAVIAEALAYYGKHKSEYKTKKIAARDLESKFPPTTYGTYRSALKGR